MHVSLLRHVNAVQWRTWIVNDPCYAMLCYVEQAGSDCIALRYTKASCCLVLVLHCARVMRGLLINNQESEVKQAIRGMARYGTG